MEVGEGLLGGSAHRHLADAGIEDHTALDPGIVGDGEHLGAIRNNNEKMFKLLGPDTGFDAIHDLPLAAAGHKFFSRLASEDRLAKTILYCLNPKDNELLAVMAYTFNDGTFPGKLPASEMDFIRQMVKDISYNNAKRYFDF